MAMSHLSAEAQAPKVYVGVLTYNAISSLRWSLLEQTMASIDEAFPTATLLVMDNGSQDGSEEAVKAGPLGRWIASWCAGTIRTSPGAGRNTLIAKLSHKFSGALVASDNDIIVLSDDDMLWRPGAEAQIRRFWAQSWASNRFGRHKVALLSALLEPEYPWSPVLGTSSTLIDPLPPLHVFWRKSLPAAAWTFRLRNWDQIGPLKETIDDEGEDIEACKRLRAAGYSLAAMDLAEHIGAGYSQLGNDEARALVGRPVRET